MNKEYNLSDKSQSDTIKAIGKLICDERKEKAFTRTKLAKLAGLSVEQLRRLESGTGKITMLQCLKVVAVLNMNFSELMRKAGESRKD